MPPVVPVAEPDADGALFLDAAESIGKLGQVESAATATDNPPIVLPPAPTLVWSAEVTRAEPELERARSVRYCFRDATSHGASEP